MELSEIEAARVKRALDSFLQMRRDPRRVSVLNSIWATAFQGRV